MLHPITVQFLGVNECRLVRLVWCSKQGPSCPGSSLGGSRSPGFGGSLEVIPNLLNIRPEVLPPRMSVIFSTPIRVSSHVERVVARTGLDPVMDKDFFGVGSW